MKKNIVLIGMPSCGKTTLANQLSEVLHIPVYDSDALIVESQNCSIANIFEIQGEAYFRKLEHEMIVSLSKLSHVIISTGGGVILNEDNMKALKENGMIFFIDRPLHLLLSSDPSRPLSKDEKALKEMYAVRLPLYQKYADAIVKNDGRIEEAMRLLMRYIGGSIYDYHHN